jgi:formylglycine-generating enzyme required for sulfatase activity
LDNKNGELEVTRLSSTALSFIIPLSLLYIIAACPKSDSGVKVAGKLENMFSNCPENMAYVKAANICMDIFEYPNASGEIPIGGIKWQEAAELCHKNGKRLPTIEEWEMACGGVEKREYPYGNNYNSGSCMANQKLSVGPLPSGSLPDCRTPDGVYDLSGNLWEWTSTKGFEHGAYYVKGGSWSSYPSVATCSLKAWEKPDGGGKDYGFRCVKKL